MKDLHTLGSERVDALAKKIRSCPDVKAAQDETMRWLDGIGEIYANQPVEDAARRKAGLLLRIARAAFESIGAVNEATVVKSDWEKSAPPRGMKELLHYIPALMSAAAGIGAVLAEESGLGILCILGAVGAFFAVKITERRGCAEDTEIRVLPRVNADELVRRVMYLLKEIDGQLMEDAREEVGDLRVTNAMLQAVQMLIEAQATSDGSYALKGIAPLGTALERQGVEFTMYESGHASDFELLPAPVGGKTIRPAVKYNHALLLRGQATVKK